MRYKLAFSAMLTVLCLLAYACKPKADNPMPESKATIPSKTEEPSTSGPINYADIKVEISKAEASSTEQGYEISKALDGDLKTYYHSSLNNYDRVHYRDVPDYFPIVLSFMLTKASQVDYLVYHPRQDNEGGHLKEVEVEYSIDGSKFDLLEKVHFADGKESRTISLKKIKGKEIKALRLRVLSGHGEHQGFAAIAELELFRYNPNRFNPLTLFTDQSCSALRPETTLAGINSCPEELYRKIALELYHKRYDAEFRIASYQAYPHPYRHLSTNKMQFAYSLLDNPTGIAVEEGEELVLFVGNTHGEQELALRVVDYYQNGENDGLSNVQHYPLSEGLNNIKMNSKGLVYVYYIKPTIEEARTAKEIKIHFVTGLVNGYYDAERVSHKGRWQELLNKAKHPYFDVLGRYSHLTYPVKDYKSSTPSADDLTKLYDDIMLSIQEFHGLQRYGRTFVNRMHFTPAYRASGLFATHEHTAYSVGAIPHNANPQKLREEMWGVAHEISHMHQTPPDFMWQGMTECTVNIPTLYVQTVLLGRDSRIQVQPLSNGSGHNSYTGAFNELIVHKTPHPKASRGTYQLVPFWQLQLYFGEVLRRSPHLQRDKGGFYPDLYEYFRKHPSIQAVGDRLHDQTFHGKCLLEFTYIASVVSGYNLIDFFEKWGFLRPVRTLVKDYDQEWVVITKEQIETMKQRINSRGLASLGAIPIEYITDKNVHLFKDYKPIVQGEVSRLANELTLTGWRNVVAFEVLNAQGELIYASDGYWTNGNATKEGYSIHLSAYKNLSWQDGYKVQAVSARGERIPVPITKTEY